MSSTAPATEGSSCRSAESDSPSVRPSEVTPRRRIKMARWWDRLGGRPVDHTASPRSICRQKRHSYRNSKSKCSARNHVIQQKCAKTKCVRANLPPHSTPFTPELYLRTLPDARQKAAIFPFFSRCHGPAPAAGSPIRVLCDTLISLEMWLPGGGLFSGGAPKGRGAHSRHGTTTLIFDTNGSIHPSTGSPDALVPATPGCRNEPAEMRFPTHPSVPAVELVGNQSTGPDLVGSTIHKCAPDMPTIQNVCECVRPVTITPPTVAESS